MDPDEFLWSHHAAHVRARRLRLALLALVFGGLGGLLMLAAVVLLRPA